MIRFEARSDGWPEVKISLEGVTVFLDQFAMKKLAKEDPVRRLRFTQALRNGGDLVFSVSNAAELTGPTGDSAKQIKEFLSGLGAHWFPVEMDAKMVSDREVEMLVGGKLRAMNLADNIASKKLVKDFFADRLMTRPRGELADLSPDKFFDLGWFMEKLSRRGTRSLLESQNLTKFYASDLLSIARSTTMIRIGSRGPFRMCRLTRAFLLPSLMHILCGR